MKQIFIPCCFFMFLSTNTFSQVNPKYNFTISLIGFSSLELPRIADQDQQKYVTNYFSGALLKLNDNQISYRLSGNFIHNNINFQSDCTNCNLDNGRVTDYNISIGFEKNLNYARVQPYFAFDAGYRYNCFSGIQNSINLQRMIYATEALETIKDGFTAAPAFGIKINPIDEISIFAEGGFQYCISYLHTQTISQDLSATLTQTTGHKQEILFKPITIGIQFHLGNKD